MKHTIAIFGESERGSLEKLSYLNSLPSLVENLGQATENGRGVHMAIQAIMYQRDLIFFKVSEEGFNLEEYLAGFHLLESKSSDLNLAAIALPGVGDRNIIDRALTICEIQKSFLIIKEQDLYDFMTQGP